VSAVTLATVKAALPGYGGSTDDTQLQTEIDRAEAQVAAFCGWPSSDAGGRGFASATYTLHPSPSLTVPRLLPLPFAAASVTGAYVTETDTYDATTLVDPADYTLTDDGLWATATAWTRTPRGCRVVCVAGWASGSSPDTVEAAVVAQTLHRWRILRSGQGIASATQQGTSVQRDALVALPPLVQDMARLSPAYRWSVAIG